MAISDLLNRRVRALPDEDEEVYSGESASEVESDVEQTDLSGSDNGSDDSLGEHDSASNDESDMSDDEEDEDSDIPRNKSADNDDDDDESDNSDASDQDDMQASLSNISFGALAKAQASLGPHAKRKLKHSTTTPDTPAAPSPLDEIRARIRETREQKRPGSSAAKDAEKPTRSSKHAPMVLSSKHAVSRKRTIIEPPAVLRSRDPRFDPTVRGQGDGGGGGDISKAYAFLDEYRSRELKELKERFAKVKDPREKEQLKGLIRSATDRQRTIENRRREKEVMAEHKKREKQLILEGKKSTPYFLKKSDLKKQVLVKKYEGMGSRQRVKALERRQKKMTAKERKEMPMERRGFENDAPPFNNDRGGGQKRRRLA